MRRSSRAGLTLGETLVASAVMALLGTILARTYTLAYRSYQMNIGKLEVQQRSRTALQRITPILYAAIPTSNSAGQLQPAILEPAVGPPPKSEIRFRVPVEPVDPRAPVYQIQRIWLEHGAVRLDRNTPSDPQDDRVLCQGLDALEFLVLSDSTIQITARARVPHYRSGEFHESRLQTMVQLPFKAMR
jgi:hypothetical protein